MLGVHLPLENPLQLTAYNAKELGLYTFQMFIRNNRNMKRRFISELEFKQFNYYSFKHIVIHAPYAMNPSADDVDARRRYLDVVNSDLLLCSKFNAKVSYVLHPGSCQSGRTIAMSNLIDFFCISTAFTLILSIVLCCSSISFSTFQQFTYYFTNCHQLALLAF